MDKLRTTAEEELAAARARAAEAAEDVRKLEAVLAVLNGQEPRRIVLPRDEKVDPVVAPTPPLPKPPGPGRGSSRQKSINNRKKMVAAMIGFGQCRAADIAERANLSIGTVGNHLRVMASEGDVVITGAGPRVRYEYVAPGQQPTKADAQLPAESTEPEPPEPEGVDDRALDGRKEDREPRDAPAPSRLVHPRVAPLVKLPNGVRPDDRLRREHRSESSMCRAKIRDWVRRHQGDYDIERLADKFHLPFGTVENVVLDLIADGELREMPNGTYAAA